MSHLQKQLGKYIFFLNLDNTSFCSPVQSSCTCHHFLSFTWYRSTLFMLSPDTCWTWLPILPVFTGKHIQTGIGSRLGKTEMKHLIFHVVFSLFLHVTIWPNLFFWACHGKAAHPANMPDEVWSLHPNPALLPFCPHSCSALQLTGGRRHSPPQTRGQMEASLFKPETSEADQSSVIHNMLTLHPPRGCQLSLYSRCWDKIRGTVLCCVHSTSFIK